MDTIPIIILHNPFRILGVYANSAKKDIVKNKGKATAFLKVNKPVEFPLDLKEILPLLTRTLDSMNEAEGHLSIAKEQIKYAQFWFLKITPLDEIAFNHLLAGNMDEAISIWSKHNSISSLQNKIVCYLIKGSLSQALSVAQQLYSTFGDTYIEKIDGSSTLKMSATELRNLFIDSLGENLGMMSLLNVATDADWKTYISKQTIDPLISKISSEVDKAKKVDHKDSTARLNAARKLYSATKNPFNQLKSLLRSSDPQYQMIADKLSLEILQCAIDYYNNSEDDDAPYTAIKMMKTAQLIIAGTLAKQRCEENVNAIQKIIDKLPPIEVRAEDKAIKAELRKFANQSDFIRYSIQLIKECAPHIVKIKEKLGIYHQYYLKISTTIVENALGNIIVEVNEAHDLDFDRLKYTLISAWRTQLYMDKFDLEPEYEEGRYKECREALYKIINDCKGFEDSLHSYMYKYGCGWCNDLDVSDVDLRTEDEIYQSCHNLSSYLSYLKKYPFGKYVVQAKSNIEKLRYKECKTIADFQSFIKHFPNSSYVPKAEDEIKRLIREANERKAKIAQQEKLLSACGTIDEVVALYESKKKNWIVPNMFSLKAYELAKSENDYRKVLSIFGSYSSGGQKSDIRIKEIERNKEEKALKKKKILKWGLWITIPLLILFFISLIWGIGAVGTIFLVVAGLSAMFALGAAQETLKGEADGCGTFVICVGIAVFFGLIGSVISQLANAPEPDSSHTTDTTVVDGDSHEYDNTNSYSMDFESKNDELENQSWDTESDAWQSALSVNTISAFTKYQSLYPKGAHIKQCEKKLIDLTVSDIFAGDHGDLPEMDRKGYGGGSTSYIKVTNSTSYTLTLLYSGPDSKRLVVPAGKTSSIRLKNGNYRVAASVFASNIRDFAGNETLHGGKYSIEYYIYNTYSYNRFRY